jgi:hypothetical protein
MSESKSYEGSCHCGNVKFNVTTDLASVMECNCSHCSRKGFLLTFVPPTAFELTAGNEAELTEYTFNKHKIKHKVCPKCGVQSFARGTMPDGSPIVAVNVRCLPAVDKGRLAIQQVDGAKF